MGSDLTPEAAGGQGITALDTLCRQLLQRWRNFPSAEEVALRAVLAPAIEAAKEAEPEFITVMNPVSRPARLRLHSLVDSTDLDSFYHREWAELAISSDGICYLVYRRQDGGDYAVEWSSATSVPTDMLALLPPVVAKAMLEGDGE